MALLTDGRIQHSVVFTLTQPEDGSGGAAAAVWKLFRRRGVRVGARGDRYERGSLGLTSMFMDPTANMG
jgi:hypothetical protein